MAFYNNEIIISHTDRDEIYVFKKDKNMIIVDYYSKEENNVDEIVIEDLLDEFDILLREDGEMYLLYQSLEQNLKIKKIDKEDSKPDNLTGEEIGKVFELNLFENNSHTNIIYLIIKEQVNTYSIVHHMLIDGEWNSFNVEDIVADTILNPIKIIEYEKGFSILYYNENRICIKSFNLSNKTWEDTNVLTDNNKKLYIDALLEEDYLHLSYCEFINDSLEIKYIRYNLNDDILKDMENDISTGINPTNPTLLAYDKKLWLVWNESLNLFSRYSEDNGETWSPIYLWKDVKKKDFVRYKYINNRDENIKVDYSFGTIGDEITFLGFGPLTNVEEIDKKKLQNPMGYPSMINNWRG